MLAVDESRLPADSPVRLVAQSSAALPEFVLADSTHPRFVAARWRRRNVRLDGPVQLDQHLLSYCERGGAVATIVLDGVQLRAQQHAGSVTFLPAGCYERWLLEASGDVVHLHLYIATEAMGECLGELSADERPALAPFMDLRDPWFDSFFHLLAAEYEACRRAGTLQTFDLLDRVGSLMLRRLIAIQRQLCNQPAGRVAPLRQAVLRQVQTYVGQHLAERITLDRLAAMASMSVDHFVRAFEQATGTTPHRWIVGRRLEAARALLRAGSRPIEAIARECGFPDAAHFSATFRRHHGITPSAYRRLN